MAIFSCVPSQDTVFQVCFFLRQNPAGGLGGVPRLICAERRLLNFDGNGCAISIMKTSAKSSNGFTLVEMMVVIAVIGVLTAIAIPTFVHARENSRNSVYVANVRTAAAAFVNYATDNKTYPPSSGSGSVPAGMESYLTNFRWTAETPIGGNWSWDCDMNGYKAGIAVSGPTVPLAQIQSIDRIIDDGDLNTGQFRSRPGGFVFVIEE